MKPEHIFALSAALFGVLVTQMFKYQLIGEWVNSFFMIPYDIAIYVAPISCSLFACAFSHYWYKMHKNTIIGASLVITIPTFLSYGVVHSVIASLSEGGQSFISLIVAYIALGGVVFLPVIIIFGAVAAYFANNRTNKSLSQTGANDAPPG